MVPENAHGVGDVVGSLGSGAGFAKIKPKLLKNTKKRCCLKVTRQFFFCQ